MSRIDLSRNRYWAAAVVMAAAVFLIIGSFSLSSWIAKPGQAAQLDPRKAVEQAWQRARQLGSYRFTTNLEASTTPAGQPVPENSARYERLYLEGQVDLPAQKMELSIWEKGGKAFNTRQAIQMRVEGEKTYGRVGSGEWQEMEESTDAFAPGRDPMAYLAGASDIFLVGTGTAEVPTPAGVTEISYSRYGFSVDGVEFVENMRSQLERQLAEEGELPPGVTIDVAQAFKDLTGQGEIWIDEAGLPLRLIVDLVYPEKYGEETRSHVKTDFSGFPDENSAILSVVDHPLIWARQALHLPATVAGWGDIALSAALIIACLALVLIMVGRSRSRAIYIAIAVVIILSMLVSPIWQSQKVLAYTEKIQEQRQKAEAQQVVQKAQTSPEWDPRQDPLAATPAPSTASDATISPAKPIQTFGGVQATGLLEETALDPNGDDDHDGLTNQEEIRLGTDPTLMNSDMDQLGDGLEVNGFSYQGSPYYTNPLSSDTIGDGIVDTLECWNTIPATLPDNTTGCNLDSDHDGQLDIFETDNDNDGVADSVDISPFSTAVGFSEANPFQLVINKLQQEPVLVDLQIRPTNPDHLGYTLSVLDWPTGDTQGQVQRVLNNTFATAVDDPMTPEEIATDPRVQYGDMRLIPMLEITVPYKAGHTRNLPVKAGFVGPLDETTPLDQWLDMDKLANYGMAAHYLDETGRLAIYIPLNLVQDETGGSDVAFQAHYYYEPQANADWGNAHEIRVIWWVQALTDQCDSSAYDENTDGEFEEWCAQLQNRIESPQIVHTYPEQWSLTGFSVREDHGLDTVVAFEDPDYDTDVNDDDYLWKLANGMDSTFIAARDCDPVGLDGKCLGDGRRDVTLDVLENRFDNRENIGILDDDPILWNIPKTAFQVWKNEYPHQDYMITMVTTTTLQILDEKFLPVGSCLNNCNNPRASAPTLLYATEAHARTANLDMSGTTMGWGGALLTVDMDPVTIPLDTVASLSWSPFRHGAGGWEPYPLEEYLAVFDDRLDNYFPLDPNNLDSQDETSARKAIAIGYYLGMTQGTTATVQSGGTVHVSEVNIEDLEIGLVNAVEAIYRTVDSIIALLENYHAEGAWEIWTKAELAEYMSKSPYAKWANDPNGARPNPYHYKSSGFERFCAGLKIATSVMMGLVAVTFMILSLTVEAPSLAFIQGGLMAAGSTILLALSIGSLVKSVTSGNFKNILSGWRGSIHTRGFKLAVIGLAIDILAQTALFLTMMITSGSEMEGWEIAAYTFYFIITVAITIILFALYMIPVIGDIIYAIVSLLNAVFSIICAALGDDFKESMGGIICKGVSGILGALAFKILFSVQTLPYVPEEDEEGDNGGLVQSSPELTLSDPNAGFMVGAQLSYSFNITRTNRLTSYDELENWKARQWSGQFNEKNLKKTSYDYLLTPQEANAHEDLYLGKEKNWVSLGEKNGVPWVEIRRPLSTQQHLTLSSAGLNQAVGTYYNEGYDLPLQECWGWPPISGCGITSTSDTGHSEIGQYFLYDVFPADLDGFRTLQAVTGGYRLAWGGSSMAFPVLTDADGDGIIAGSDPNDSKWDNDNDGLSDPFESQIGTNPSSQDSDNDGVLDRKELLNGSNPNNLDSDHDGLSDKLELDGWEFVYGWVDASTPKIIHVSSNPAKYDSDNDGVSDHKEWLYGWNPWALSQGNVLTFSSDLKEKDSGGQYTSSDNVVRSGDQLRYEAEVKNELDLRYMRGLLSVEYPAGSLGGSVDPKTFLLGPHEPATISGDLTVTSSSSGSLDLTQIAGAELYQANASSNYLALLLHLEEPAGATVFLDKSGGVYPNNATCPAGSCPDQRVAGVQGQAVQFTALGQRIDASTTDISRGSFSAMLWMKTPNAGVRFLNSGYGTIVLGLNTSGQVQAAMHMGNSTAIADSTAAVNDNLWHHLAMTYAESTGTGTLSLYVDGYLVESVATGLRSPGRAGVIIGNDYLGGLDEVAVYNKALTAAEIQDAVLKSKAGLDAHLDEPANTMTFVDASGQNTGSCLSGQCPKMEVPGMNRTAAEFDGVNDFIQYPHTASLDFPASQDFSVVLWVKPGAQVDTTFIKTGEDALPFPLLTFNIPFQISYVGSTHSIQAKRQDRLLHTATISANVAINDGQFHHVAYVKQGGTLSLYIDGVEQGSTPDTAFGVTSDTYPLYIGRGGLYDRYFGGRIDGVRVYRRALSQVEIQQLQVSDLVPLNLHFEDPPGTYQFQDANGQPPASCPSSLADCPTSGVPGRWNLAAEFNGSFDYLDAGAAPSVIGTNPLSLAAWVRTTAATYQVIVNQRSVTVPYGEYMFGLRPQGKVYWSIYGDSATPGFNLISAKAVNDGKWHHVAAVRDVNGSAYIYIDGVLDASLLNTDVTKIVPLMENYVYIGADIQSHTQYFDGLIDELQIWRSPLSATQIGELMNLVPRFQLHMEEAAGANSFVDDTELGYNATCSGTSCPNAGVNGQVGLAAEFDGLDDGLNMKFDLMNHEGTVMVWVRPNSATNLSQAVIASIGDDIKLYRENGTWKLRMRSGVVLAPAEAKVRPDEWQHLAIVLSPAGAGTAGQLYLDGAPVSDVSPDYNYTLRYATIGYDPNMNDQHFDGRIDEVTAYNRALSPSEVKEVFDYQAGWVQQIQRTGLTVDNEPPTVQINLPGQVIANKSIQLRIETADATTSVKEVLWRYNGGTWYPAPACHEADVAAAWCPTFTPAGPGTYTLQAIAADLAGNSSATASATLQVDNNAPTATLAQEGTLVQLQAAADQPFAWIAALSGTVSDASPSSGVASVRVALTDPQGVPVAGDSQSATISGGSWSINYLLSEPLISGQYTVQLETEDKVGNHRADRSHSFLLDRTAPEATFDGPLPGGALALWRLNEPAGSSRFFDSSGLGNDAVCNLSCPVAGGSGKYGTGINLAGSRSLKTSRALTVGESGMALSAWFQTSQTSQQTLFAVTDSSGANVITVKLDASGKVQYNFSPPDAAATNIASKKAYNNNAWHHLAAQWQPGQIQLYLDGQLVRSVNSAMGSIPAGVNVVAGLDANVDPFVGNLDEIAIHGVHLTPSEVRSLAFVDPSTKLSQYTLQGTISELKAVSDAMMALHMEETANPFVDSSDYDNDATCTGTSCPVVDSSGPYGSSRRFDGSDDGLSILSSSLNYLTNNLTVMAWVKPERLSGVQRVLGISQCSTDGGLSFGLIGSGLIFTTYGVQDYYSSGVSLSLNQWQHIAAVMGTDNSITFYVNGIEQQTVTGILPANICLGDIQIGRSIAASGSPGQWFQGSIDEAQIFDRALTPEQILAMAQKQNAGIASLEVAYTSDLAGSTRYNSQIISDTQLAMPLDDTEDVQGNITFLDTSGTGHSGTCAQPNCPSTGQMGHLGSAAVFDGTDLVAVAAKTGDVTNDYYTISAWIYPIGTPTGSGAFLSRYNWTIARNSDGSIRWVFRNGSTNNAWYNTGIKTEAGKWTQITVVFDAGVVKTYTNGVLKHTYPTPPNRFPVSVSNNSTLNVGGWPSYGGYFNGGVDDVNLISRALTDSEVMSLYLGNEPVLHLPFDESWLVNSNGLADTSGWEQNAILTSGASDDSNKVIPGQVGSGSLQLDGVDDYVEVANQTGLNFSADQDFSVSLWIKADPQVDTINDDNDIVEKWSGVGGYPYVIRYVNSTGNIYASRYDGTNGPTVSSTTAINNNQFHHVAFIKRGANLYLYIDGVQQGTVPDMTTGDTTNISPLFIGMRGNKINHFKGAVDDLQIYARALSDEEVQAHYSARWQATTLSASGSAVMYSSWNQTLPVGLEGHYRVDFRSQDNFGNHTERRSAWDGVLDTTAPRATFTYEGGPTTYTLRFSAQDWNLDETKLQTPCPTSTTVNKTFFNPPWYRALTGVTSANSIRLYSLDGSCQATLADPTQASLTAYDLYGNSTTIKATVATATAALAAVNKPAPPTGQVLILAPAPGAILNNLQPVSLAGTAQADAYLKRLTVSVDGKKVLNEKWDKRSVQAYDWTASWTPTTAGTHLVEAALSDWKNAEVTHTVTFTLDTESPNLTIATSVLTSTHVVNSQLPIWGTATDENGIALVEVQVEAQGYTSDWTPATMGGDDWQALVYPGFGFQPDDEVLSVRARATDRSGRTQLISGSVTADLKLPAPSDLAISYDDLSGTYPITRTGTILTGDAPTLHLSWTPSSDGAGLAGYKAGWIVEDASGVTTPITDFSPTDTLLASYQAGEAQKLFAGVASFDQYGNQQSQGFGPIYVDSPLTPDYITLGDIGETYHGWMDSSCSLLGRDRRVDSVQPENATRGQNQALYATWDAKALRLAWTGANWSGDGDLFVYLETTPGGTLDAMNPYTSTVATLQLPGVLPLGPRPNAMYADYIVWVQDDLTAWLYRWDGTAWVADSQLGSDQYRFEPGLDSGMTDLYLPFEQLGIGNPQNTALKVVAFATEEGSLQLWAVLPQSNPVTSPFVTGRPRAEQLFVRLALNHPFSWGSLGSGACPNGSQALLPNQRQYTDDDLQLSVTADPVGASYRYMGDHLFGWWLTLFGDKPSEFSSMLATIANEHGRVRDGQEISYTVHYKNDGAQAAQDVMLQVRSRLALILPDGTPQASVGHAYYQEFYIGDVAPGQSGTVTVRGKVDLAWAQAAYQDCLALSPTHPRACEFTKRWALLSIQVFDQAHTESDGPRELLWADHRVDSEAPVFAGIGNTAYGLSAVVNNTLRGYAYDESGIETVKLEIEGPNGSTTPLDCNDPTPLDGQWNCGLNLDPAAQDGDTYRIRLRAKDTAGLEGIWSQWQTFVVDRTAPDVTVGSVPTHTVGSPPVSLNSLNLVGQMQDNYGVHGVEVCQGAHCEGTLQQYTTREWSYPDLPSSPVAIGNCSSGKLERTFSIPENHTVGEIRLGLQAEITHRDHLVVELTSPAGTTWQLISDDYDRSTSYGNLSVILSDRAAAAISALRANQSLTGGGFEASVRPHQPLAIFNGQVAAGTWKLSICQDSTSGEQALYRGAQLWAEPPNTAPLEGSWQTSLQLDEMDDEYKTVFVYGIDSAGNRSPVPQALTFRIDNVTPVITVTQVIPQLVMQPDLAPQTVLTGSVSDGGNVTRMHAYVRDPDGIGYSQRPVVYDDLTWQVMLQPMMVGVYQVWIAVEDEAGNLTTVGPFTVDVAGIQEAAMMMVPMATPTPTATITSTVTLTPTLPITPTVPITSTVTAIPTATPTPQPTQTPTPAPALTETPTPALPWTETPTPTSSTTITPTLVLTPTVTIMPLLAQVSLFLTPPPISGRTWSWFR